MPVSPPSGLTRFFEDLEVGEVKSSSVRRLTREEITTFAREYDPQWFHADADAARESVWGEVVASGIQTMALWRQLDHEIAHDIAWICGVGWDRVRWPRGLKADVPVRARSTVLSKRPSSSDPMRGVVVMRYELLDDRDGQPVWVAEGTNLIRRRHPATASGTHSGTSAPIDPVA